MLVFLHSVKIPGVRIFEVPFICIRKKLGRDLVLQITPCSPHVGAQSTDSTLQARHIEHCIREAKAHFPAIRALRFTPLQEHLLRKRCT